MAPTAPISTGSGTIWMAACCNEVDMRLSVRVCLSARP
jgi:hypothetical protein